jgi:transposase
VPADLWDQFPSAAQAVIVHLCEVIQAQQTRLAELEARLGQHSQNSDRPPSSDPPARRPRLWPRPTQSKPGAKPGHPGHRQALLVPTAVIDVLPEACRCGQATFPTTQPYHIHQVIELPMIEMVIQHFVLHAAPCPQCGRRTKVRVPTAALYGYGPRLTALIGALSGSQRSSRSAVQAFCSSVLGVAISRGAIQRMVERVSDAIGPHYQRIGERARGARVNHVDETTWYRHGVVAWLWVMVNPTGAFFSMQASRSKAAFEALIGRWAGLLVSDGYGVYHTGCMGVRRAWPI